MAGYFVILFLLHNFLFHSSSISLALFEIIGPKRPLKPVRKSNNIRTTCRLQDIPSFNVVINVERAFGIPTRCEEPNGPLRKNSNISSTTQCKINL